MTHNVWIMFCGLANVIDGLIRILSFGFIKAPGFSQKASLVYAKWSIRMEK